MGMYDHVEGKFECPECGAMLTGFQTKSYACMLDVLDYRMCDYFYTSCTNCETWVEVNLDDKIARKIYEAISKMRLDLCAEDYDVTSQTNEERYGEDNEESGETLSDADKNEEEA